MTCIEQKNQTSSDNTTSFRGHLAKNGYHISEWSASYVTLLEQLWANKMVRLSTLALLAVMHRRYFKNRAYFRDLQSKSPLRRSISENCSASGVVTLQYLNSTCEIVRPEEGFRLFDFECQINLTSRRNNHFDQVKTNEVDRLCSMKRTG